MATFFISDLHLKTNEPKVYEDFLHFLHIDAYTADAIYILGDLFEVWIGDDDPNPLNRSIACTIKSLVNSGVPCFFVHGNHDFLLGKRFAHESGMILLPEEKVINLYGYKILIMHGDTLCTNDIGYQVFRNNIRRSWIQALFLSLPFFVRNFIVNKLKKTIKSTSIKKTKFLLDVDQKTVVKIMKKHDVQYLIHGHSHRENICKFTINRAPALRLTLGSWSDLGSMIKVTPKNIELIHYFSNISRKFIWSDI